MTRGLTMTQPWASLVAFGAKRVETRSWSTKYRGRLLIHASAKADWEAVHRLQLVATMHHVGEGIPWARLPLGAVVATAELVDCVRLVGGDEPEEPERSFGDYAPGRYAWRLDRIERLTEPVICKGALQLWEPSALVRKAVGAANFDHEYEGTGHPCARCFCAHRGGKCTC